MVARLFGRRQVQPDPDYVMLFRQALSALQDHAEFNAYDSVITSVIKECAAHGDNTVGYAATALVEGVKANSPLGPLYEFHRQLIHRPPVDSRLKAVHTHLANLLIHSAVEMEAFLGMAIGFGMEHGEDRNHIYFTSRKASEDAERKKDASNQAFEVALQNLGRNYPELAYELSRS